MDIFVTVHQRGRVTAPAQLPGDICCNCGTGGELTIIDTDLRRRLFLGVGGVEASLILPLPYCRGCKRTALVRKPNLLDVAVWWGIWSLFAWIGLMGAIVIAGQKTHRFGLVYAIGAGLVTLLSIVWYRRPRAASGSPTTSRLAS